MCRNSKKLKRNEMPRKMLKAIRAKDRERKRANKALVRHEEPASIVLPHASNMELDEEPFTISQISVSELNAVRQRKERYRKQLQSKNLKLNSTVKQLQEKLKRVEKENRKFKKRFQRLKRKQIENSMGETSEKRILNLTCRNTKIVLSNLKQKYIQARKPVDTIIVSKLLKRYRLMGLIARRRKLLSKTLPNKNLSKITAIHDFYLRDDVSRVCAGKKETVTRGKIKEQRRYLCDTMKSLYKLFKTENKNISLSYTSFTRLKPFYIKKPSAVDRNTCACQEHANINFKIMKLFQYNIIAEREHSNLMKDIMCDNQSALCAWGICQSCKAKKVLVSGINEDETCKYYKWEIVAEERASKKAGSLERYHVKVMKKVEKTSTLANLTNLFQSDMQKFKKHAFNVKNQYNAYRFCKENLKETEAMIHVDFSENYSCKLSEEVQSFHFGASRNQASLHTGLIYLRNYEKPISFCTISESLEHGPGGIWAHLDPILEYLKECAPQVSILHFFSDGPSSQYKQKNNFYLLCHRLYEKKFKCATWSFFEKSHGKGAADGVGAVVKRTADGLVAHGADISNAESLYNILLNKTNIKLFYINVKDIFDINKTLPKDLMTIRGTRDIHQIMTNKKGEVTYRNLSCYCANNNWMAGKLCLCHGFKAKSAKINRLKKTNRKKTNQESIFYEIFTDSDE